MPATRAEYVAYGFPDWVAAWAAAGVIGGAYGVDLFFVLSSYLITELLLRENRARGSIDVKAFYIRRALRIWPLYYLFVIFAAFIFPLVATNERFTTPYVLAFLFFCGNWACAMYGYPGSVANHLWSVSIEEQFYIVWPVVLSQLKVFAIRYLAPAMIVIATLTRIYLAYSGAKHPGVWCNTFARLDPIATGAILALSSNWLMCRLTPLRRVFLLPAGMLIMLVMSRLDTYSGYLSILGYPMVSLGAALILLSFLGLKTGNSAGARLLAYLGHISYGLYVYHVLAIRIARKLHLSFGLHFAVSLVVCIMLAWLSYRWFESPFLRLKTRFTHMPSGAPTEAEREAGSTA